MKYRELLFVAYTKVSVATGYNLNKFLLPKDVFTSYFQICIQGLYEADDHVL